MPIFGDSISQEVKDFSGEVMPGFVDFVMRDVVMENGPKALNGIKVRAIGW